MVDLSESRLEAAKKFGATHTICSSDIAEIKAFINEVTDGRGVDISMECVGYPIPLMSAKTSSLSVDTSLMSVSTENRLASI